MAKRDYKYTDDDWTDEEFEIMQSAYSTESERRAQEARKTMLKQNKKKDKEADEN